MLSLLALLVACGSAPDDKPLTSKPAEPTEELTGELPSKPQWSDLEGFFPDTPGLPLATPGLELGMPMEQALRALKPLSLGRVVVKELAGRQVASITLKAPPEVALAVVSDPSGTSVETLQYTVPAAHAERVMVDLWGVPGGFTLEEEPAYEWRDEQLQIEWHTVAGKSAGLLSYSRPSSGE